MQARWCRRKENSFENGDALRLSSNPRIGNKTAVIYVLLVDVDQPIMGTGGVSYPFAQRFNLLVPMVGVENPRELEVSSNLVSAAEKEAL